MIDTTYRRTPVGHCLSLMLATMLVALGLTPGTSSAMQRIQVNTDSDPVVTEDEIRQGLENVPWVVADDEEEDPAGFSDPVGTGGTFTDTTHGFIVEFPAPWVHMGTQVDEGLTSDVLQIRGEEGGLFLSFWEWTGEYTVTDYIAWWAMPDYSQEWLPGGTALRYITTPSQGAVIHVTEPTAEYPEQWVYVTELYAFDGYAIEIVHFAPVSSFEESYTSIAGSLLVGGFPVLGQFTYAEIEALLPAT